MAEEVRLFDTYTGAGIPPETKGIGVSVTYRAPDRTLSDEEVDAARLELLRRLEAEGIRVAAVCVQMGRENSPLGILGGTDDRGSGPVSEQDGHIPAFVREIEGAGMHFGPHDEYPAVHSDSHEGIGHREAV